MFSYWGPVDVKVLISNSFWPTKGPLIGQGFRKSKSFFHKQQLIFICKMENFAKKKNGVKKFSVHGMGIIDYKTRKKNKFHKLQNFKLYFHICCLVHCTGNVTHVEGYST